MARDVTFDIIARDKASRTLDHVGDSASKTGGKLSKFGKFAAAGVAAAGVALIGFGIASVKAFAESEEAQNRLTDAFKRFPKLADTSADALRDYNRELARKVRFDDDALASGQAQLAAFNLTGKQVRDLTPLLADYAAKTGKDLPTAATDFGKALQGQGRALKAVGLNLKDTGSAAGNYTQLVAGLRTQVGGFSEREGATFSGKLQIMRNQFDELKETVGSKLVPVLSKFLGWLLDKGIPALERFGEWIGPKLSAAAALFSQKLGPLTREGGSLSGAFKDVGEIMAALKVTFQQLWPVVGPIAIQFINNQIRMWQALAAAIAIIKAAIGAFVRFTLWGYELVLRAAAKTAKALGFDGLAARLDRAARDVRDFAADVNAALNGIKNKKVQISANLALTYSGNSQVAQLVSRTISAGGQAKVRSVRMMAEGGPFSAGQMAIVGERGPELVQFGDSGRVIPNGQSVGGGGVTVHVHNAVIGNEREIARVVTDAVRTATARGQLRPA